MDAMSGGTISADREAERTVRTVSETCYGRISGIGYCVTSVARRLTATSAPGDHTAFHRNLGLPSPPSVGRAEIYDWNALWVHGRGSSEVPSVRLCPLARNSYGFVAVIFPISAVLYAKDRWNGPAISASTRGRAPTSNVSYSELAF